MCEHTCHSTHGGSQTASLFTFMWVPGMDFRSPGFLHGSHVTVLLVILVLLDLLLHLSESLSQRMHCKVYWKLTRSLCFLRCKLFPPGSLWKPLDVAVNLSSSPSYFFLIRIFWVWVLPDLYIRISHIPLSSGGKGLTLVIRPFSGLQFRTAFSKDFSVFGKWGVSVCTWFAILNRSPISREWLQLCWANSKDTVIFNTGNSRNLEMHYCTQ